MSILLFIAALCFVFERFSVSLLAFSCRLIFICLGTLPVCLWLSLFTVCLLLFGYASVVQLPSTRHCVCTLKHLGPGPVKVFQLVDFAQI